MAEIAPACGGERYRACAGVTQAYAAGELCSRVANKEWGGGAFCSACGQLKGPLEVEESQGAKIRYYGRYFATVAKIMPCSSFSPQN